MNACVQQQQADLFRKYLRQGGFFVEKRKVTKLDGGFLAVPVNDDFVQMFAIQRATDSFLTYHEIDFYMDEVTRSKNKHKVATPRDKLVESVKSLFESKLDWNEDVKGDLPKHWEKHGDLLLLPVNSFQLEIWKLFGEELWITVAASLGCNRVAKKNRITNNAFRSPRVDLLHGEDGWVEHIDNKINYMYDVTKCMFSAGNISEKLRISKFDCRDEVIVDLYAGIGYFTLPYLVHAGARFVYSCEWNPDAAAALQKNLNINGVNDRCTVLFGDNRQTCPKDVADRVNCGLIPSSEQGWPMACAALRADNGGIIHIHGNVSSKPKQKKKHMPVSKVVTQISSIDEDGQQSPTDVPQSVTPDPDKGVSYSSTNKGDDRLATKREWNVWATEVCNQLQHHLQELHRCSWSVYLLHTEHVKSYAPHIDHLVADIKCSPKN